MEQSAFENVEYLKGEMIKGEHNKARKLAELNSGQIQNFLNMILARKKELYCLYFEDVDHCYSISSLDEEEKILRDALHASINLDSLKQMFKEAVEKEKEIKKDGENK